MKLGVLSWERPLIWIIPLLLMLLSFTVFPLLYSIWLSFFEYAPLKRSLEFVGLANWQEMFADVRMWEALWTTVSYFVVTLFLQVVLGMAIALLLDAEEFGFLVPSDNLNIDISCTTCCRRYDVFVTRRC